MVRTSARRSGAHGVVVGDDHDGQTVGVELVEQVEQRVGVHTVEVSGGLVGEEEARFADRGARDGHPLPLTA